MMADLTFTDEDIAIGPVLGPEYRASQRFAEGVMADFQEEHLQPIIKMVADQVQDKLWDVARDWLFAGHGNQRARRGPRYGQSDC